MSGCISQHFLPTSLLNMGRENLKGWAVLIHNIIFTLLMRDEQLN